MKVFANKATPPEPKIVLYPSDIFEFKDPSAAKARYGIVLNEHHAATNNYKVLLIGNSGAVRAHSHGTCDLIRDRQILRKFDKGEFLTLTQD